MASLMQTFSGGVSAMGNMFGMGGGANPPGTQSGVGTTQQYMQQGANMINPSTATMSPAVVNAATGSSPSTGSMDPLIQALTTMVKQQTSTSPYLAGIQGLGPVGAALLQAENNWQLGSPPRSVATGTQQPGQFQFGAQPNPSSPLATAALMAELL